MDESPSALTWLAVDLFLCVWPGKENRSNPTSTHVEAMYGSSGEVTQLPGDGQQFPETSLRPPRPG